ncbi:hypothetical protein JYQ62_27820 [Nostoc sp. UHCC 0702]|nr:hypothetical protein JYQ62_27820 [Nostoc sp. UHCC 0702]
MLECFLISVDHALILVFSASIQADCLIVSDRVAQEYSTQLLQLAIPGNKFFRW